MALVVWNSERAAETIQNTLPEVWCLHYPRIRLFVLRWTYDGAEMVCVTVAGSLSGSILSPQVVHMEYNRSIYQIFNGFPSRWAINCNRTDIGTHVDPTLIPC